MTQSGQALGNNTGNVSKQATSKARRYRLQDVAARLLPGERVSWCCRHRKPGAAGVDVNYTPGRGASYGGLMRCGSVWTCPVCGARISEERRAELAQAVGSWTGTKLLLTLTLQHSREDDLAGLLDALKDAWRKLKMGRAWQTIRAQYGLVAYVTGTEVTYGNENGWHPHLHVLVFSTLPEAQLDKDQLKAALVARWRGLLAAGGRYASEFYGLDLRTGDNQVGEYASKFGLEAELTGQATKIAAGEHYTPFQLLELAEKGDQHAGQLFREYAAVFNGRKQLTWSKGARELLGLNAEREDAEIAEEDDAPEAETMVTLTPGQWGNVCERGARGQLLAVANGGDRTRLWEYLLSIGITPVDENFTGGLSIRDVFSEVC